MSAMSDDERRERVTSRLAASPALEEAVRRAIGEGRIPDAADAQIPPPSRSAAADDRARLEEVVPLPALEAIVQRVGRPPMLIRGGVVELEPLPDFPVGTDALIRGAQPLIPGVGRVEFLNHSMAWAGTGWVLAGDGSERIVVTNRHVASLVARRTASGAGTFLRSPTSGARYGIDLDFGEEVGSRPQEARPFRVTDLLYLADDGAPDVALLRIRGDDLPAPLSLAEVEAQPGDLVAIVGYPAFDSRNDPDDQARYFHDLYDVKRFAPGLVMQALTGATTLDHDCTTLGGNSGSPLLRLHDARVVGLHFAGVYGKQNSAVGLPTLRSFLHADGGRLAVVVPRSLAAPPVELEAAADKLHPPEFFTGRTGYDAEFLGAGFAAPWPGLPDAVRADLARPDDENPEQPGELRYTHFGVRFSTSRRQPLMTAVNIDGASLVVIKRSGDRWYHDGRLPLRIQLTQADYADRQIDRGHLVRRQDPNWDPAVAPGAPSLLAERANLDTFHYTNAAPQHSELNQGATMWLGLENYVLESAHTHGFKACVFTGPVNRDDDPQHPAGVRLPREFWKCVVMVDADRRSLHATAYLLSQGDLIRELLEKRDRTEANEGFVLGPYRTYQLALRDLADATGYDFSAYVDADPLGRTVSAHEARGVPVVVPLDRPEDIVV